MTCAPRLPCPSRPPPNLLLYVSAVMLLYLSIKTFLVSHPPGFVIGAVAAAPPCPSLLTRSSSPAVSVLGREVRRDSCGLGRGSGRWRRPGWISEWWARFPSVPFTLTGSPQPSDTAFLSSSDAPPPQAVCVPVSDQVLPQVGRGTLGLGWGTRCPKWAFPKAGAEGLSTPHGPSPPPVLPRGRRVSTWPQPLKEGGLAGKVLGFPRPASPPASPLPELMGLLLPSPSLRGASLPASWG